MSNNRLGPKDRKRTLIAPLVIGGAILALLGGSLALQHKSDRAAPPVDAAKAPPTPPTPPPALPAPQPALTRRDLIEAANLAAADYAVTTASRSSDGLIGRRFTLKLPFGCDGPQMGGGASQAYFEFDPTKRTVKLVARPGEWTSLPLVTALRDAPNIESVEGFWLSRPWSFGETCPPSRDMPVPATPTAIAGPTLGLARIFESGGSRLLRRDGRAYELVRKIPEGDDISKPRSFRLVLEGRIGTFSPDRPIVCWAETSAHRPICLIAADFDRVAFEDADGKLLAEWRE